MEVSDEKKKRLNTSLKMANILNTLQSWSDLTDLQSSIMMFCLLKAQQGQNICTADEIKNYLPERLYQKSNKRLFEVATSMLDAVARKPLKLQVADDNYIVIDHIPSLFEKYRTYQKSTGGLERIEFSFNRFAMPFIQDLRSNYTLLELRDYYALEGRQTKRLYTLLRQFRTTGEWIVSMDQFKLLMGCGSYSNSLVKTRVLEPAISQLKNTNLALKKRIIEQHAKAGNPLTEEEIIKNEEDGMFCLFFNLDKKFIKKPHSKKIDKIIFTFEPQDPLLNHEQNYILYKQRAQQPHSRVDSNGHHLAQTQSEVKAWKKVAEERAKNEVAQEKIKQLEELIARYQTGTLVHTPTQSITLKEDPAVHRSASLYRAEQSSLCAEGVSCEQFHQMTQSQQNTIQHPTQSDISDCSFDEVPPPEDKDAPDFEFYTLGDILVPKITPAFSISEENTEGVKGTCGGDGTE